jgi:DNA polymerase III delta prime subunit
MSVNKLLLWEKWRPKTLEDMILLPRIRENFENGLDGNYIFYGHYGTGKTSLARILIGKYTKDRPFLEINSSLYTSIDVLRNEIEDFCKFTPMIQADDGIKYVFLDEFERTSAEFQDGFKAFIEKYSRNGVRFIITTNHISKISDGIKSRIPQIDFDCKNIEEEKYLKKEIFKKIQNEILPSENYTIKKENLIKIVTKKFPDFRSTIEEVKNYIRTDGGVTESSNVSNQVKLKLYDVLYDEELSYEDIYHFLMNNFGAEQIDVMIKFLGKPFIDWSIKNNKNVDHLFECNFIISDYSDKLENSTDPIVLGLTIIGKLRNILI